MRAVVSVLFLAGAPAGAMTVEECQEFAALAEQYFPPIDAFEISDELSADGWCQVAKGPSPESAEIDWRAVAHSEGFSVDVRLPTLGVAVAGGSLTASAYYDAPSQSFEIGPMHLTVEGEVSVALEGVLVPLDLSTPSAAQETLGMASVRDARLGISGLTDVFAEGLSDAFGLDVDRARSNEVVAEAQRREMLSWLDRSLPGPLQLSWQGFREIVEDYPNPGPGYLKISLRDGATIPVSAIAVMWFDIQQGRQPDRAGLSGLTVTWTRR